MGRIIINHTAASAAKAAAKATDEASAMHIFDKIYSVAYNLELVGSYLDDLDDGGEASKAFNEAYEVFLDELTIIESAEKARIARKYIA